MTKFYNEEKNVNNYRMIKELL